MSVKLKIGPMVTQFHESELQTNLILSLTADHVNCILPDFTDSSANTLYKCYSLCANRSLIISLFL